MNNHIFLSVVGGSLLCLLTLINTDFGLLMLIISMLLSPEFQMGALTERAVLLRFDDVFLLIVFFTWIAKLAINKELSLLKYTPFNLPITFYTASLIVSTALGIAYYHLDIKRCFFYLLKYLEYFMLFFMVVNCIKNRRQVKMFVTTMLLTAVVVSVFAIRSAGERGRAVAPFEHMTSPAGEPNTLGGYLVIIFCLSAGMWLYESRARFLFLWAGIGIVSIVALVYTYSRGSYLAFVGSFVMFAILSTRRKALLFIVLLFFGVMWQTLLPQKVNDRITSTFASGTTYRPLPGMKVTLDESANARVESWQRVGKSIQYSPLFGFGVTGIGFVDGQFPLVMGEAGLLGLGLFIWLLFTMFKEGIRVFRSMHDDFYKGIALAFVASLTGVVIHSFSTSSFIVVRIMEPFWFLAAILVMLPRISTTKGGGIDVRAGT
jgi:hypothetical protein